MTDDHWIILILACIVVVNWTASAALLYLAYHGQRIRALTEWAWLATLIAAMVTVTLARQVVPGTDVLAITARVLVLIGSFYPLYWLWCYFTNRF